MSVLPLSVVSARQVTSKDEDLDISFWLCPISNCAPGCEYYLVDADAYLEATLEHRQGEQKHYCMADAADNT